MQWRETLSGSAATWLDEDLLSFGDPAAEVAAAAEGRGVAAPLTDTAIIRVHGADAEAFLQAQLSHDIELLSEGRSQLAGYCSPKGRLLALFRLLRRGDDFLLLLPRSVLPEILKRLRMFVLRSKVTLEETELRALGVAGEGAAEALAAELAPPPEGPDEVTVRDGALMVRLPAPEPMYLLLGEALDSLWMALAARLRPVGPAAWRLLEVRAGLPQVLPGAQESFVPQMANLDLVNGLSFSKGCYPGQEIVARMHFLGSLKRRMYRFALDGEPPTPGVQVRDERGARVGEVVMAAPAPGGAEGLAVLQIERAQEPGLVIDGAVIEVQPPPYPLSPPATSA